MSRKQHISSKLLLVAAALAGTSGAVFADDSSLSRFGGDSYAYFNRPPAAASGASWRQSHPDGISQQELQALSSSSLSAASSRLNPPVFARAPADPGWREAHPSGLTERELQALSSSSLATWHSPVRIEAGADLRNVAQSGRNAKYAF